ncbi:MAG: Sporulation initiation inhibitor protein Soj [candidate division WS2 bacterium]|nr:Sporulation initiation inhibitor protein Soj [Candidatus Psychracetigena formicireducens]
MTKVISTINLKGGVGKTQMTVALAEFLAMEHNKRVLLIDLDPQTNATVSLIDENVWLTKDQNGETLLQLFKDKLEKTSRFNINQAIVRRASNVAGGIRNLDLLPSSLGLIEIQDSLPLIPAGRFYVTSPVTILKEVISGVLDEYDLVLIDCPPNLGIITLNGIYISDYYLIPCIPDILSTYGIPQIIGRVKNFKQETKINIEPLGIVISMYRAQSRLHDTTIRDLRGRASRGEYPRIFDTVIPLTVRSAESADFSATVNTLKQKYGYGGVFGNYQNLTKELLNYV